MPCREKQRATSETACLAESVPACSAASRISAAGAHVRGRSGFPDFHPGFATYHGDDDDEIGQPILKRKCRAAVHHSRPSYANSATRQWQPVGVRWTHCRSLGLFVCSFRRTTTPFLRELLFRARELFRDVNRARVLRALYFPPSTRILSVLSPIPMIDGHGLP